MDLFRQTGVPNKLISDNAKEFHSVKWTNILRKYCVDSAFIEPHHQNENVAERRGGTLKNATWYLLHITGAPTQYWCYCLEYILLMFGDIWQDAILIGELPRRLSTETLQILASFDFRFGLAFGTWTQGARFQDPGCYQVAF